jgi:AbrB family looped-hinge helix DNA binding protein
MTFTARYGNDITLPKSTREKYGLKPESRVRIIETRDGILLIPLTDEPMDESLREELSEWQQLGEDAWEISLDEASTT